MVKDLIRSGYKGNFAIEHYNSPDMLGDMLLSGRNLTKWIAEA